MLSTACQPPSRTTQGKSSINRASSVLLTPDLRIRSQSHRGHKIPKSRFTYLPAGFWVLCVVPCKTPRTIFQVFLPLVQSRDFTTLLFSLLMKNKVPTAFGRPGQAKHHEGREKIMRADANGFSVSQEPDLWLPWHSLTHSPGICQWLIYFWD